MYWQIGQAPIRVGMLINRFNQALTVPVSSEGSASYSSLANFLQKSVNAAGGQTDSSQRVSDFIEYVYFKNVQKRPSTIAGYRHIFEKHLKDRLGDVRVFDFTTGQVNDWSAQQWIFT